MSPSAKELEPHEVTKEQAAAILGVTTRQIERLVKKEKLAIKRQAPGKTKPVPVFSRADVEALAGGEHYAQVETAAQTALVKADDHRIATSGDNSDSLTSQPVVISNIMRGVAQMVADSLSVEPAPAPWLTLDQAAAWLGLTRSFIERERKQARKAERWPVRELGRGSGLRLCAVDLRLYFDRLGAGG